MPNQNISLSFEIFLPFSSFFDSKEFICNLHRDF